LTNEIALWNALPETEGFLGRGDDAQ